MWNRSCSPHTSHRFAHGSLASARGLLHLGQAVTTGAERAGQKFGGWGEPDRSWWQSAFVHTARSVAILNLAVERPYQDFGARARSRLGRSGMAHAGVSFEPGDPIELESQTPPRLPIVGIIRNRRATASAWNASLRFCPNLRACREPRGY